MNSNPPRVFISYSHDSSEHMDRVLELADRLRSEGIDAQLDQYEAAPRGGWPTWMRREIRAANFVLVVCTASYERRFEGDEEIEKGRGVTWEGGILTQELYEADEFASRLVPVYFDAADLSHVPIVLRRYTSYDVGSEAGYDQLYRRLTGQEAIAAPELGKLRQLPARQRRRDVTQDTLIELPPESHVGDEPDKERENNNLPWGPSMTFRDALSQFLNRWFSKASLSNFICENFNDGESILGAVPGQLPRLAFVDEVLATMKLRGLFDSEGCRKIVGSLVLECPDASEEIRALAQLMRKPKQRALSPLSYGAADGEFRNFSDVYFPSENILEPQVEKDRALPALEFVRGPRTKRGRYALHPDLAQEVLLHTIHAGHLIPNTIVEDQGVREWFDREDQRDLFLEEKDWGANQMAEAIANELGLDGYLRVNVARCVLDFGRFPGVSPHGADHLQRLSVNADLGERIGREKVDELLQLYHAISSAFERAVSIKAKAGDGTLKKRQRKIILGIHTYDKFNRAGTLRPPVSLISRSRTYDLNHTMHPGSFDRLFPDELAEFTADRCLLAAISHSLERERIGVADNHPYSMPDGCVEIRSQVWYFFKFLRRRFEEAQRAGLIAEDDGLSEGDYTRVWDMLLDTTQRHTESASLRSYVHRHRVSIDEDRKDEFERYRNAYEVVSAFCSQRKPGRSSRAEMVDAYRLDPDRPSSLGLEVRKDLVWRFDDPHDDHDPRRIRWRIPVQEGGAVIQDNVRRIARLIAAGIHQYLEDDLSAQKEAKQLYDQTVDF